MTKLGVITMALTEAELACLPLSNTAVVATLGSFTGWPSDKVSWRQIVNQAHYFLVVLSRLSSMIGKWPLGPLFWGKNICKNGHIGEPKSLSKTKLWGKLHDFQSFSDGRGL